MSLKRGEERHQNGYSSGDSKSNKEHSCYFCNEAFELGLLQIHLKQCGSILEQCPLRCGAWIQRKHKEKHVTECPRMEKSRNTSSPTHARPPDPTSSVPAHTWTPKVPVEDCVAFLEKEIASIKLVLTEEANQRDVQASDIETVRTKLVLLEERTQHFLTTIVSLRETLDDEAERSANWANQFKHDLSNVQIALQELQSQQLQTAMRLESAVSSLVHEQRERELLEKALTQHDARLRTVHKLEEVIEYIKQALNEERQKNAESRGALEAELLEARRSSVQLSQLANVRAQLQGADSPTISKLAVVEVSVADARAETSELSSKVDSLSRDLRALTKSYLKIRSELVDFQSRVSFGNQEMGSDDGHLIWRIDNFTARMKDAKENDTILSSPLFRTSKYGYTLKAEVHLNGIGKWKGRHITSTVRLVTGPYDTLLQWPCDLTVNIVLRDQTKDRQQAMDIVKSLDLRRKSSSKRHDYDDSGPSEPQAQTQAKTETQSQAKTSEIQDKTLLQLKRQYVFIPHTSLDKFDYIKKDVIFLEFIANH